MQAGSFPRQVLDYYSTKVAPSHTCTVPREIWAGFLTHTQASHTLWKNTKGLSEQPWSRHTLLPPANLFISAPVSRLRPTWQTVQLSRSRALMTWMYTTSQQRAINEAKKKLVVFLFKSRHSLNHVLETLKLKWCNCLSFFIPRQQLLSRSKTCTALLVLSITAAVGSTCTFLKSVSNNTHSTDVKEKTIYWTVQLLTCENVSQSSSLTRSHYFPNKGKEKQKITNKHNTKAVDKKTHRQRLSNEWEHFLW